MNTLSSSSASFFNYHTIATLFILYFIYLYTPVATPVLSTVKEDHYSGLSTGETV